MIQTLRKRRARRILKYLFIIHHEPFPPFSGFSASIRLARLPPSPIPLRSLPETVRCPLTPGPPGPTPFSGNGSRRIDRIQQILDATPGISRTGLAMRVAEALKWRNPDGRPKFRACLGALERLEELGILTLPLNRVKKRASGLDAVDVSLAIRETPVTDSLDALQPITLQRQSRGREDLERVRRPSPLSGLQAPLRLSDEVFHHGWPAADPGLPAV